METIAFELTWLSFVLRDLKIHLTTTPMLSSTLYMTVKPIHHTCTKHTELDYHYVCERVVLGSLETWFVPSSNQLVDVYTKPLPKSTFHDLKVKLGLCPNPMPTLRGSDRTTYKSSWSTIKSMWSWESNIRGGYNHWKFYNVKDIMYI